MFEQLQKRHQCVDYEFAIHHTLACGSSKFSDIVTKTSVMTLSSIVLTARQCYEVCQLYSAIFTVLHHVSPCSNLLCYDDTYIFYPVRHLNIY